MSHGEGHDTITKEEAYLDVMTMILRISTSPLMVKRPFWSIEMNAGCGYNHKSDCPGSPLVLHQAAIAAGRPVHVFLCEKNPEFVTQLQKRLANVAWPQHSSCQIFPGDNARSLPHIANIIRRLDDPARAIGTIFVDPNAWNDGLPLDDLDIFTAEFRRIDVIVNLNIGVWRPALECKRRAQAGDFGPNNTFRGFLGWPEPEGLIWRFHKPYPGGWMVRNPRRVRGGNGGGHNFLMLVGTGHVARGRRFKSFYPIDSWVGKEILRTLDHVDADQGRFPW
jgi:hypothetical protein